MNFFFSLLPVGHVEKRHHKADDLIVVSNRVTPIFRNKGGSIRAPQRFFIGMCTFPCQQYPVNRAVLFGMCMAVTVTHVNESVDMFSDEILRRLEAQYPHARRIDEGTKSIEPKSDDSFRRGIE